MSKGRPHGSYILGFPEYVVIFLLDLDIHNSIIQFICVLFLPLIMVYFFDFFKITEASVKYTTYSKTMYFHVQSV